MKVMLSDGDGHVTVQAVDGYSLYNCSFFTSPDCI